MRVRNQRTGRWIELRLIHNRGKSLLQQSLDCEGEEGSMIRLPAGAKIIQDDLIAIVWRLPNGDCRAQGKRVGKDFPLTYEERRRYVAELGRSAIFCKFLMEHRGISLGQAWKITKEARGFESLTVQRRKHGWGIW